VDIPPQNGRFTWSNKRTGNNNIKERLDRILVQDRTVARFSNIQSKIIHGFISDHKPVALTLDKGKNLGPLPFKYNKAWDSKEEFRNLIKEQWEKEVIDHPIIYGRLRLNHSGLLLNAGQKTTPQRRIKKERTSKHSWNNGARKRSEFNTLRKIRPKRMKYIKNCINRIGWKKKNKDKSLAASGSKQATKTLPSSTTT